MEPTADPVGSAAEEQVLLLQTGHSIIAKESQPSAQWLEAQAAGTSRSLGLAQVEVRESAGQGAAAQRQAAASQEAERQGKPGLMGSKGLLVVAIAVPCIPLLVAAWWFLRQRLGLGAMAPGRPPLPLAKEQNSGEAARTLMTAPQKRPEIDDSTGLPDPICKVLVMHRSETVFEVPLGGLTDPGVAAVHVSSMPGGITGKGTPMQLVATVGTSAPEDGPGNVPARVLTLSSVGFESEPRCSVYADLRAPSRALSVFGRKLQEYGTLEESEEGGVLHVNGQQVVKFIRGASSSLEIAASSTKGQRIASSSVLEAARSPGSDPGKAWSLSVEPGGDAVLMLSCMLGMARFWTEGGR